MQYSIIRYCSSSVTTQRATRARDNVAVVGDKGKLELDSVKKELLKTIK